MTRPRQPDVVVQCGGEGYCGEDGNGGLGGELECAQNGEKR